VSLPLGPSPDYSRMIQGNDQIPMANDQLRIPIELHLLTARFARTIPPQAGSLEIGHWSFDPENSQFCS